MAKNKEIGSEELLNILEDLEEEKEKVTESKEFFLNIINNIGNPVFVKDSKSRFIIVNDAFCEMVGGVKRAEVIGKTFIESISNEGGRGLLKIDKQVLSSGRKNTAEEIISVKGNGVKIISTTKTRFIDRNGKKYLVGVTRDVTKERMAEKKVEESEYALNEAQKNSKTGSWNWDILTGEIIWSKEMYRLMGVSSKKETPSYESVLKRVHPDDREMYEKALKDSLEKNNDYDIQNRITLKNNVVKWVDSKGQVITDESGKAIRMFGTVQDITERVLKDKKIKENEEKLKLIIEHSDEMFYIHDTKHVLNFVSPRSLELLGYTPKEMMVRWTSLVTESPINKEGLKITEKAIKTGKKQPEYHLELRKKSGEKIIVRVDESPVKNEAGKVVAVSGAIRDITERKISEEKLKESEERYHSLIGNIPDVVWTTSENGETTFISPAVEKVYGFSDEEIYNGGVEIWFDRIHEDDAKNVTKAFKDFFKKGVKYDVEYRIKNKAGKWIWLHDKSTRVYKRGGKRYADGIFNDITEQKKIEEKIKKTAEEWESTFNAIPDLVSIHDENSNIVRVNKAFVDTLGIPKEKILGRKCYELIHNRESKINTCPARKAMETNVPSTEEYYEPKLKAHLEITASPIVDNEGVFHGVVHIVRNATKRKEGEEFLKKKTEELESFNSLAVDRELKMIELKKEINELLKKLNAPEKYSP